MLLGLQRVSAVAGSLLLNLEAVFTMAVALVVFREHMTRRELSAASLIIAGAALACLSWALDNNRTQSLSIKDPFAIVRIKTLGAGTCTLVPGLLIGRMPALRQALRERVIVSGDLPLRQEFVIIHGELTLTRHRSVNVSDDLALA